MPTEIAIPFRLDGNGHVVTVTDLDAQVYQHVAALLGTHPDERPMVPGYGTDLTPLMFADIDTEEVASQVTIRARAAIQAYEPGVELLSVEAADTDKDDVGLRPVALEFRRLDAPDSSTVANANMAVIGTNGVVREIVRG